MNKIRFVPTNIKRQNCVIYSAEKNYPLDKLERAVSFLRDNKQCGVYYNDSGEVKFVEDDSISWTLTNVYLAYNAYTVAKDAGLSFYCVMNDIKVPELFISNTIHNGRIVVNAHTMESLYVTHPIHRSKLSSLIDKTATIYLCFDLFYMLRNIAEGSANYIHSLLINRGRDDEKMRLSPMMTIGDIDKIDWTPAVIEAMEKVLTKKDTENEYFVLKDFKLMYILSDKPVFVQTSVAENIISSYDKLCKKKGNYIPLCDTTGNEILYCSTNLRYLVNARSFQIVTIHSQSTRSVLQVYMQQSKLDYMTLQMVWNLAELEMRSL